MIRSLKLALAAALVLTACSAGGGGSRYSSCVEVKEDPALEAPSGLRLPQGATVTDVTENKGYTSVTAVADSSVEDLYLPVERELGSAGFEVIGREFEGFDAELFFSGGSAGSDSAGVVRMRSGPCADQVTLSILYDPIDTKKGRAALKDAKRTWTGGKS